MAERGRHPWATKPMRELFDAILSLESRAEVGVVPAGSLHDVGAGGDGAPLAGGAAAREGTAVPGDRGADARLDDDRDARGALAEARRRRLQAGARPQAGRTQLLKVALPVKGRLREPSFKLLEDAGLGPEQPGERALAFPCRNAPVEVLLVRAADIPEYVQDGVVDCGITGIDLVRERGARVSEVLKLGFGSCRLEAAVPAESAYQRFEDLAGALGRDRLSAADPRAAAGRGRAGRRRKDPGQPPLTTKGRDLVSALLALGGPSVSALHRRLTQSQPKAPIPTGHGTG